MNLKTGQFITFKSLANDDNVIAKVHCVHSNRSGVAVIDNKSKYNCLECKDSIPITFIFSEQIISVSNGI